VSTRSSPALRAGRLRHKLLSGRKEDGIPWWSSESAGESEDECVIFTLSRLEIITILHILHFQKHNANQDLHCLRDSPHYSPSNVTSKKLFTSFLL
jgi:hypothetical protein